MSQSLRDMLANRKFAVPMIALLALCLIGLFLIGIVIIFQPGKGDDQLALVGDPLAMGVGEDAQLPTETLEPTQTASPTATPTSRPTATLVPVGTVATEPPAIETVAPTSVPGAEVQPTAAASPTSADPVAQATQDPSVADSELAETGLGWGLILVSGVGLAALALVARRMRLANY